MSDCFSHISISSKTVVCNILEMNTGIAQTKKVVWLTQNSVCHEIFVCELWPSFLPLFDPAAIFSFFLNTGLK